MKLPFACTTCRIFPSSLIEVRDDGRYEVICSEGHRSVTFLQQQLFEILFEIGAYAMADGYYREAVSSFAASLERFYEFWIRALMLQKGVDPEVIDAGWKPIARQSERQLGAFIVLYTMEFHRAPELLGSAATELRNDVIHKGRIPTRIAALQYGQAVLDVIRGRLKEAHEEFPDGVQATVFNHLLRSRTAEDHSKPASTAMIRTIVSVAITEPSHHTRPLEEAVASLPRWRGVS